MSDKNKEQMEGLVKPTQHTMLKHVNLYFLCSVITKKVNAEEKAPAFPLPLV